MAVQIAPFELVCFWPSGQHECYRIDQTKPVVATIAWCNADGTVNLGGFDHHGAAFAATDVKVLAHPPLPGQVFERSCWHAFGAHGEAPVGTTTLNHPLHAVPPEDIPDIPAELKDVFDHAK